MKHFRKTIRTTANNGSILKKDAEVLNEYIKRWNGDLEITLGVPKRNGSNKQNKYYWGVIIEILSTELGYEKEEMHEVLKAELGIKEYKEIVNKETGEVTDIEYLKGYRHYTVTEREDYHSKIRRWASNLGYDIPEPNE